jgi:hypothetical protein
MDVSLNAEAYTDFNGSACSTKLACNAAPKGKMASLKS